MSISYNELIAFLHYNPDTGLFTWKAKPNNRIVIGSTAGHLDHTGYVRLRFRAKNHQIHRLAYLYMTGEYPENFIDHINGDKTDNRWSNLRMVTRSENGKNSKLRVDNKSGQVGVSWVEASQKWKVQVSIDNTVKIIGLFDDFEEAVQVRKDAEKSNGYHPNHGTR